MNKIKYRGIIYDSKGFLWRTEFSTIGNVVVGLPTILGTGDFTDEYEATVENIASSVLVHEWFSHGIMHYLDEDKNHRFAYKNVIDYAPLWELTTNRYKGFILSQFLSYTEQETGRNFIPLYYMYLYDKYTRYYRNEN